MSVIALRRLVGRMMSWSATSVKHGGSASMWSSKSEANSINSPETIAATILGATGGCPDPQQRGGGEISSWKRRSASGGQITWGKRRRKNVTGAGDRVVTSKQRWRTWSDKLAVNICRRLTYPCGWLGADVFR